MSFADYEDSVANSNPIELYQFNRGTIAGYMTSADRDQLFGGNVYEAVAIKREAIEQSREVQKNFLEIEVSRSVDYFAPYALYPNTQITNVTIFRDQPGSGGTTFSVLWQGRVVNLEWRSSVIILRCEPIFTSVRRLGLRRHFQTQCPHVLYGDQCLVNKLSYRQTGTISQINSGISIESTEFGTQSDGYWAGGTINIFDRPGEQRQITSHAGNVVGIHSPISGLTVGDSFEIFPGCAHNLFDCLNKYNNIPNYGGFPYIPNVNPFGGTTLFTLCGISLISKLCYNISSLTEAIMPWLSSMIGTVV